jgi:hypothetical protein
MRLILAMMAMSLTACVTPEVKLLSHQYEPTKGGVMAFTEAADGQNGGAMKNAVSVMKGYCAPHGVDLGEERLVDGEVQASFTCNTEVVAEEKSKGFRAAAAFLKGYSDADRNRAPSTTCTTIGNATTCR